MSSFRREYLRGLRGELLYTAPICSLFHYDSFYRGLDLGYAAPSEVNPTPDSTAVSPIVVPAGDKFVLYGHYPKLVKSGMFQHSVNVRNTKLCYMYASDWNKYGGITYIIPSNVGAGQGDSKALKEALEDIGGVCEVSEVSTNVRNYRQKASIAFDALVKEGRVKINEESFEEEALEYFYNALETYPCGMSATTDKSEGTDMVDALLTVFMYLINKEENE